MDYKPVKIKNLIEEVIQIQQMKATIRKIDLLCEIDEEIQNEFTTDPGRLKQILLNLISSSMKLTTEGYVKVKASLKEFCQNKFGIEIQVINTGMGISAKDQKMFFQIFSDLTETEVANLSGTGISLYQSNKFAKKMGLPNRQGIQLTSEQDKGSTFAFVLEDKKFAIQNDDQEIDEGIEEFNEQFFSINIPILQPRVNIFRQLKNDSNELLKEKKCCPKILIVDDAEFNIHALTLLLSNLGYDSHYALDGKRAIEKVLEQEQKPCKCKYSLILLDCNMPVLNGYDTCQQLKEKIQKGKISSLIIIAATAKVTTANKIRCEECGFDNFLPKPIMQMDLNLMLNKYLVS